MARKKKEDNSSNLDPKAESFINETVNKVVSKRIKKEKSPPSDIPTQEKKDKSIKDWQRQLMKKTGSEFLLKDVPLSPEQVQAILELPVYGSDPAQTVSAVTAVKTQQRLGNYYIPAQFCDSILQDSVIYATLQVRVKSLLGTELQIKPADESELAQQICEDIENNIEKMVPITEVEEMLRWGLLLGTSISQLMWDSTSDGKWMPELKIMHPKYMFYNWATRLFNLTTQGSLPASSAKGSYGTDSRSGWIQILPDDIQWNLFTPYTDHLPWMRGLILPLAMLWLIRNWNEQWWTQHQERNGSGLLVAITSAEALPEEERLFINQLANLGASPVVRSPQGVEGNKFDVRREDPSSDLYQGFKELLDYVDRRIAMVVLGQDKTTMAKTSGMSIGGNDAGEEVRLDLMRSDAKAVADNIRKNVLERYVLFNYGEQAVELTPYICFDVEPEENLKQLSDAHKTATEAIMNLMQMPIANKINFMELFERYQIPLLSDDEAVQIEQIQPLDQKPNDNKDDNENSEEK